MSRSKIVLRMFGPKRLIASVKSSVRSCLQHDSSGLGLWSTNDSEPDLTPSSGLSVKTSKTPRLRRSNMNASFMAMRVSQVETATFPERRRDEGRPCENSPAPHLRHPPCYSLSVAPRRELSACVEEPIPRKPAYLRALWQPPAHRRSLCLYRLYKTFS